MKQKTAMMELIEWLNLNGMKPDVGIPAIKDKAQQLLEKEKEQIIEAFDYASNSDDKEYADKYYYNETYKQD